MFAIFFYLNMLFVLLGLIMCNFITIIDYAWLAFYYISFHFICFLRLDLFIFITFNCCLSCREFHNLHLGDGDFARITPIYFPSPCLIKVKTLKATHF